MSIMKAIPSSFTVPVPGLWTGVYFLLRGPMVVYVGQSVNVMSRVANHVEDKEFDAVHILPVIASELDAVEGAFIRHFRPVLNKTKGPVVEGVNDNDVLKRYIASDYANLDELVYADWQRRMRESFAAIGREYQKRCRKRDGLIRRLDEIDTGVSRAVYRKTVTDHA